jgi:hypothetical protein
MAAESDQRRSAAFLLGRDDELDRWAKVRAAYAAVPPAGLPVDTAASGPRKR